MATPAARLDRFRALSFLVRRHRHTYCTKYLVISHWFSVHWAEMMDKAPRIQAGRLGSAGVRQEPPALNSSFFIIGFSLRLGTVTIMKAGMLR